MAGQGFASSTEGGPQDWGNLSAPVTVADFVEGVSLWVHKESAAPKAAMHVWFFESDGDGWPSKSVLFGDLKPGWNRVRLKLREFRFEKRGDGP